VKRITYVLGFLLVFSLISCTTRSNWPSATRNALPLIPSYPNRIGAEQQTAQIVLDLPGQVIEFQTSDSPKVVLNFYKNQLLQSQWERPFFESDDMLIMDNRQACPIYNIPATTSITRSGLTHVVIDVSPSLCIDR
jgi:hypothetical protein